MKKNKTMRLASGLLVAVLLTTCTIAGTFAKYVTEDDAQDSARVAKWGVTVEATGESAFAETYAANATGVTGNTVVTSAPTNGATVGESLLAPGTSGDLASIAIGGTPEVMVDVAVTANLELTGWKIGSTEYCPIVFTVGTEEIKIDGTNIKTVAQLEAAVEAKFTALSATNVAANTPLTRSVAVAWAWAFNGDNTSDTALGNLAANDNAPTIAFSCTASVTQVD